MNKLEDLDLPVLCVKVVWSHVVFREPHVLEESCLQ